MMKPKSRSHSDEQLQKLVSSKTQDEDIGCAVRMLSTEVVVAACTHETLETLNSNHPKQRQDVLVQNFRSPYRYN